LPEEAKVALLERLEQMARKRDPRVAQVMASLAGEYEAVLIARSDGIIAADVARSCGCR
jgi:TldD protein